MARTHAAGSVRFHQDDGVVLGKGGVPIPTTPTRGVPTMYPHGQPAIRHMDDGEIIPSPKIESKPVSTAPTEYEWRCDRTTWGRSMDGFQVMHLLNAMMQEMFGKELAVILTDEQARKLPSDTRWHFKRQVRTLPREPVVIPELPPETSVASLRRGGQAITVKNAPLTSEFDVFILAALALGGDWTAARLRDFAVATDSALGVEPNTDLRQIIVRLMNLTKNGLIESMGHGAFRMKQPVESQE